MAGFSGFASRDVVAKVRYFARNPPPVALHETGAHYYVTERDRGLTREEHKEARHAMTEEHEVKILDARTLPGGADSLTLEENGLMLLKGLPPPVDFNDRPVVKRDYYPQLLELAKQAAGAENGIMQTYAIRTEDPVNFTMAYAGFAHSDAGPSVVANWRQQLLKKGMPEEEAMSCEICMFNVWHPWERPAWRDPLCLLDAASMTPGVKDDASPMQTVKYTSQYLHPTPALGPLHEPQDRWVYCSDMRPDEAWLFKQYDTRPGVAKCSFHTSFHDPFHDDAKSDDIPGRRSCEFRMLLTFPKSSALSGAGLSRL